MNSFYSHMCLSTESIVSVTRTTHCDIMCITNTSKDVDVNVRLPSFLTTKADATFPYKNMSPKKSDIDMICVFMLSRFSRFCSFWDLFAIVYAGQTLQLLNTHHIRLLYVSYVRLISWISGLLSLQSYLLYPLELFEEVVTPPHLHSNH
jgi:hypothetical protein